MEKLYQKAAACLEASEYFTSKSRKSGNTYQSLTCPACGEEEAAWAYQEAPLSINCNRLSQCGARTNTVELFNLRQDIEKEYKPTKAAPHLPAKVYLESRGIRKALAGLEYEYLPNVRKTGRGAVIFTVGKDSNGKPIKNGRLINPLSGNGKTHNIGSTSGMVWFHAGITYTPEKPTYITEGIIDALSLIEMEMQAIAVLASGQDPAKIDLSDLKQLTLAFDNDAAGARATKKWKKHYPDALAISPDKGQDWNTILCSSTPDNAKTHFERNLPRYHVNASLLLAKGAKEYAEIYRDFFGTVPGIFIFDSSMYFSMMKSRGDNNYLSVERCGKFTLDVISFYKNLSNPDHPEYRYNLKITPKSGRPVNAVATGRDLATSRGIKEFLLTRAKVSFEAGSTAGTALATLITCTAKAPEVNQVGITGYDVSSKWYIFKYFAVDPSGKTHNPDERGLYRLNFRDWVAPASHSSEKAIKPAAAGITPKGIHTLIVEAWGDNGAAAMAWMVAGWFVNQIKKQVGYYPFLSFHGDPSSGKSALTVSLNAMQGMDGEGLPLNQLNTKKALARTVSRVSGLFTALLEDNHRNERGAFDYSILLTGYNQGSLQVKAAFSNDQRTNEDPFLGTLLFVQNTEPFNQKAEKQRVISLHFDHKSLNDQTLIAYEKLQKIPLQQLALIMPLTLQHRQTFERDWQKEFHLALEDLSPLENRRILQNHALVLAFSRIFNRVHKIKHDITAFMKETAEVKCRTSAQKDYSLADHFFETLDLLDSDKTRQCLHTDEKTRQIFINLPAVEQIIKNKGVQFAVTEYLTKSLTQHPAFIENSKQFRFPEDPEKDSWGKRKQRRVWVFDANKFE